MIPSGSLVLIAGAFISINSEDANYPTLPSYCILPVHYRSTPKDSLILIGWIPVRQVMVPDVDTLDALHQEQGNLRPGETLLNAVAVDPEVVW